MELYEEIRLQLEADLAFKKDYAKISKKIAQAPRLTKRYVIFDCVNKNPPVRWRNNTTESAQIAKDLEIYFDKTIDYLMKEEPNTEQYTKDKHHNIKRFLLNDELFCKEFTSLKWTRLDRICGVACTTKRLTDYTCSDAEFKAITIDLEEYFTKKEEPKNNMIEDIQLTLENNGNFYREYLSICKLNWKPLEIFSEKRKLILRSIGRLTRYTSNFIQDLNCLVVYFDNRYAEELGTKCVKLDLLQDLIMSGDTIKGGIAGQTYHLPIKEITMNPSSPAVEVKTFVRGVDIKTLKEDDLYNEIARLENQIKEYDAIEHKPKKLVDKIASLTKEIDQLIAAIDAI